MAPDPEGAPLIDPRDLDRMKEILRKEATGWASLAEQEELYAIVEKYTGPSRNLPWDALLKVAQYGVRLHGQEEVGQEA